MRRQDQGVIKPNAINTVAVLVILILAASFTLVLWVASNWHDQQRIGQIIVFSLCLLVGLCLLASKSVTPALVSPGTRWGMATLLLVGLISALLARHTSWALAELSLAALSIALGGFIAISRRTTGPALDQVLIGTIVLMCSILLALYFFIYHLMITKDIEPFVSYRLLWGFSNPRFFGQFLSLTLPLIVFPLLCDGTSRREVVVVSVLAALWWTVAITSGSRGLALGMAAAMAWLSLSGTAGRRWSLLQLRSAVFGLLIYLVLLSVIPAWLDIEVAAHVSERLHTSLSLREVLWLQALQMILERPLLGFGPMHFSDYYNAVAAHPHQAILQWASEWGIPSALAVTAIVFLAARATFRTLRATANSCTSPDALRVCLAGSIAAALTLSMVDGVLVMPNTQLWLAILGGWLLGLHPVTSPRDPPTFLLRSAWVTTQALAVVLLWSIVIRDFPILAEQNKSYIQDFDSPLQPRFWSQGVIGDLDQAQATQDLYRRQKESNTFRNRTADGVVNDH